MADKPTIPDFPTLPDFSQMITQACEVVASVRGIPYDFNGTLSLENKFVVLFKTVKEMFDAQDELVKSYKSLYDFINTYFDNLDVQEEVNKKIELMARDGSLSQLIMPYMQTAPVFVDAISDMTDTKKIYVLKSDGHLYYYDASWKDSGIAYGINGLYPINVDYAAWIDTINAKQPFSRRYAQLVNNEYNEAITNGSFDGKSKFVANNSSFKDASVGVIGYVLTTPITDLSNFYTEYSALVYTPVPFTLTVYATDNRRTFQHAFRSNTDITLSPGVNTINFTARNGSPSNVANIAMSVRYSESLTPPVIDKISVALVKGANASRQDAVNVAFIGDSLTAQNYMQFFSGNNFETYTYAVGGDGISNIFARTNIDILYANNTGTISNGTVLNLSQSGMFLQGYGNTNPVSVHNHTFDIKRTGNTYTVDNLSESFTYFGEPFICNIANTDFSFYVIWCGTNNLAGNTDDIINGWKKAKKVYPNCILIGLTWDSFDGGLDKIHALDVLALKEFGSRYISLHDSIVKYGLSYNNITPTSDDTANINAGKIPPSLLKDSVHFNGYGQKYVAHVVQERLKMFGII
nr:MAG TPA: XynB-like protein [Caudoviricetes sp.]